VWLFRARLFRSRSGAGRFIEAGGVRYTAAATALELEPGETVVVAETATERDRTAVEIPRGGASETTRSRRVLMLRVDLEG